MTTVATVRMYDRIYCFVARLVILAAYIFASLSSSAQLIGTVAGNGNSDSTSGNGGPATCAGLPFPAGVWVDAIGNLYITSSNALRKVNAATGVITTIAGGDTFGDDGDGGPAVNATMHSPKAVCMDATGNLYIAEFNGHRIRKIDASTGIISTIVGTGRPGFSGDGGPAISAELNSPSAITIDDHNNLYVADTYNSRIRKINLITGLINTIAGTGSYEHNGDGGPAINAGVAFTTGICVDGSGNIYTCEYVAESVAYIRKINTSGIINTVAGNPLSSALGDGDPAINARLYTPSGLCLDSEGNIYVADNYVNRIRKITLGNGIITTVAGNSSSGFSGDGDSAVNARLNGPNGICTDNSGNLYIADYHNHRVRKVYVDNTTPLPASFPSIQITSTTIDLCSGKPTFTATVTNGSQNMIYQWYRNSSKIGTNSATYSTDSLSNGDTISCQLSAIACGGVVEIKSNSIVVAGKVNPSVTIKANDTIICPGANVTFTASPSNSGNNPSYQWVVNGHNVGGNNTNYSSSSLKNGDLIYCIMTVDPAFTCVTHRDTISNGITIMVTTWVAYTVNVTASDSTICPGTPVTFTAIANNAGASPSYQWKLNGINTGTNSTTYTNDSLSDNDKVACWLTAENSSCPSAGSVSSNIISINVRTLPVIQIHPEDTVVAKGSQVQLNAVVDGTISSFEWQPATSLVDPLSISPHTQPISATTEYLFRITTADGCTASKKAVVKVYSKLEMPGAFTPNGDGLNDVFRIPPGVSIQLKEFSIFDRWGNKIFTTSDVHKGWDGKYKGSAKGPGVYLYFISGNDGNEKILVKGTFVLIK